MKVWVAVVEHRHGHTVYVAKTKQNLTDQLYDYVRRWWESEIPDEELPAKASKREIVDLYFEGVRHETWVVRTHVTVG